jgi:hypothetical protein
MQDADVRMIQRRGRLCLALEAFQRLRIARQVWRQKLHRYMPVQTQIFRFIDDAHTTAAQLMQDFVMRNGRSDHAHPVHGMLGCHSIPVNKHLRFRGCAPSFPSVGRGGVVDFPRKCHEVLVWRAPPPAAFDSAVASRCHPERSAAKSKDPYGRPLVSCGAGASPTPFDSAFQSKNRKSKIKIVCTILKCQLSSASSLSSRSPFRRSPNPP